MNKETTQALIRTAISARELSYSPYSHFMVGAALLSLDGKIYTGCNIESSAFSMCNCAERTAFFKAVSEGARGFEAIAIVGAPRDHNITELAPPCGACLQVMAEFCDAGTFEVILAREDLSYESYTLKQLLPFGFKLKQ